MKAVDRIKTFPYSVPVICGPVLAESGFRAIVVEKYIIICRVIEETGEIVFCHVFDGREDYPGLIHSLYIVSLKKENFYAKMNYKHK